MFQFPGCPSVNYVFIHGCADMPQRGFPHSDIADSSRAHTPGRRFSQCITSFVGILCPGIPRMLFVAFSVFPGIRRNCVLFYVFEAVSILLSALSFALPLEDRCLEPLAFPDASFARCSLLLSR